MVGTIAITKDGAQMVSGGAIGPNPSNYVRVWNVDTGTLVHKFDVGDKISLMHAVDISADGEIITAVSNYDDTVKIWTKEDTYKILKRAQKEAIESRKTFLKGKQ